MQHDLESSPAVDSGDLDRRKFLTRGVSIVAGIGAAFLAVPFIESWLPSERARALGGPTDVDLTKIEAGQMVTVTWRRQPIYVVRRTALGRGIEWR
jgi:ubiquinol-cytochrome c reductase iron-sulfur subunit